MSNTDPLLRALADRDPHCPDGQALVSLGELVRRHSTPPNASGDYSDDILARLRDIDNDSAESIDAYYNEGQPDPELSALAGLMQSAGPARVDLTQQVLRRISASGRFGATADDERDGLDGRDRWRIWSAVIAGHVAALLALAIFELSSITGTDTTTSENPIAVIDPNGSVDPHAVTPGFRPYIDTPALPNNLPHRWSDIRGLGSDLFLLRRFPELRDNARQLYGMQASGTAVEHGVAWLRSQLNASTGTFGTITNATEHDLATHCLATLVLLGEGLGDKGLSADARSSLDWLRVQLGDTELFGDGTGVDRVLGNVSQVTSGLICLTLVEGSLLYGDLALRSVAEAGLASIDRGLPMQPGVSGLGGFTLLALETAQQAGLRTPGRLLVQAKRSIAQSLPSVDDDAGRIGLAAFARSIYGMGGSTSALMQISQLRHSLPGSSTGRADPLGWFFATLAMREASEKDWQLWANALEAQLIPLVDDDGRVPAHNVRYGEAGGDIFATSLVLLNLQAPYRYLPLAPVTP